LEQALETPCLSSPRRSQVLTLAGWLFIMLPEKLPEGEPKGKLIGMRCFSISSNRYRSIPIITLVKLSNHTHRTRLTNATFGTAFILSILTVTFGMGAGTVLPCPARSGPDRNDSNESEEWSYQRSVHVDKSSWLSRWWKWRWLDEEEVLRESCWVRQRKDGKN